MLSSHMTLKKYLINLKLVHTALIFSLISLGLVAVFVFHINNTGEVFISQTSKYAILAVVLAALALWTFTGKLLRKDPSIPLKQRVQSWYIFRVVRGAVLESVGMTGIVASIVTSDEMYLIAPAFVTAILVVSLPSEEKVVYELGLPPEEAKELQTML